MKNAGRTVIIITLCTLACRALGLISYQLYMSFFDAEATDIGVFVYALKFPDVIFTSVGAALGTVVVPMYSSMLAKNETGRADNFLHNIISLSGLMLVALVLLGLAAAPLFPMFSDYKNDFYKLGYAAFLLRVLMPAMLFFGASYIFQGMLQSRGRFLAPACVTLPTSAMVIIYMVFFAGRFGVTGLALTMLAGLSAQAFFLVPSVLKTGYRYRPSFDYKNGDMRTAARMTPPVLAGVSAYQVNMIFNVSMATYFGPTALLRINNAQYFALAATLSVVYSITAVYFPRLTAAWASGGEEEFKNNLSETMNTGLFFLIPLTAGFILLRYQLFDLVARWGSFGPDDVLLAGDFLALYSIGLIAMGLKEILDKGFYAQKNTKISAAVGFLIMGINVAFSLIFMKLIGAYALPLSYSVSCSAGVAVLLFMMKKKCGPFLGRVTPDSVKCAAAALMMSAVVLIVSYTLGLVFTSDGFAQRAVRLAVPAAAGAASYFAAAYVMRVGYCRKIFARGKGGGS